jgi:hypothetical protein
VEFPGGHAPFNRLADLACRQARARHGGSEFPAHLAFGQQPGTDQLT